MPDEPGWLGRAQWMPAAVRESSLRNKVFLGLVMIYSAIALVTGWVVADVSSSVGWGFLVGAILLLVVGPLLAVVLGTLQQRAVAARQK